jgi:hypothetical protein
MTPSTMVCSEQHGTAGKRRVTLQFGNEFLGVDLRVGPEPRIEQAVNDQYRGLLPADLAPQQFNDLVQAFVLKGIERTEELDIAADLRGIEEAQRGQVLEQPLMGFGQQGCHHYSATVTHMVEGQLVGEDGLARPRPTLNDVRRTRHQAAFQ